jgi:ribose/xylose/arabinose/galactoside ABC-type transport system permease subunit
VTTTSTAPVTTPDASSNTRPASRRKLIARLQPMLTFFVFLLIFVIFGFWLGGKFLAVPARMLDVHQNAPIYVLALAAMVTLAAGQFDLSIASMATLTSFTSILLTSQGGLPLPLVIMISLLVGAAGGLVNAFLVVRLQVNAFVATLGTGGVLAGVAEVAGSGTQVVPKPNKPLPGWYSGSGSLGDFQQHFPQWVLWIGLILGVVGIARSSYRLKPRALDNRKWAAVVAAGVVVLAVVLVFGLHIEKVIQTASWTVGVLLILTTLLWVLLELTVTGRHIYATGDNAEAARLAGVRVERTTTIAFVLGGVLAAGAGILLTANQGSAVPDDAATFLLPAFAAAFLSTVLFSSGRFNVWGTLLGGVFLQWVSQGLIVGGVHYTWTGIVNGVVLVLAVAFSTTCRRMLRR